MSDNKAPNSQQNPVNSDISPIPLPEGVDKVANEQSNSSNQEEGAYEKIEQNEQTIKVEVVNSQLENREKIERIISIIINVIIAFGAIGALIISSHSLEISNRTFDLARKADSIGGKYMDSTLRATQLFAKAAYKNAENSDENIKIAQNGLEITKNSFDYSKGNFIKSLQASERSINAAKEAVRIADSSFLVGKKSIDISTQSVSMAKSNFETENKPYIFFDRMVINDIRVGYPISVNLFVGNFGKSPAVIKVFFRRIQISNKNGLDSADFVTYPPNEVFKSSILYPYGKVAPFSAGSDFILSRSDSIDISQNLKFIYFHGEFLYYDLVRKKHSSYVFYFRIFLNKLYEIPDGHNDIIEFNK